MTSQKVTGVFLMTARDQTATLLYVAKIDKTKSFVLGLTQYVPAEIQVYDQSQGSVEPHCVDANASPGFQSRPPKQSLALQMSSHAKSGATIRIKTKNHYLSTKH